MLDLSNIYWVNWITNVFVTLGERYSYINFFIGTFLESLGIPFASLPAFTSTGYLISEGKLNIFYAIIVGAVGNALGSSVSYYLGYSFGKAIRKKRKNHKVAEREERLQGYLKKYGSKTIFWAQLLGFTRVFVSFPAGLLRMNFKKFFLATLTGGMLFVVYFSIGAIYIRYLYDKLVYPYIGLSFASLGVIIGVGYAITHLSIHYGKKAHKKFTEQINGQNNGN